MHLFHPAAILQFGPHLTQTYFCSFSHLKEILWDILVWKIVSSKQMYFMMPTTYLIKEILENTVKLNN